MPNSEKPIESDSQRIAKALSGGKDLAGNDLPGINPRHLKEQLKERIDQLVIANDNNTLPYTNFKAKMLRETLDLNRQMLLILFGEIR